MLCGVSDNMEGVRVVYLSAARFHRRHRDWPAGARCPEVWIRYITSIPSARGPEALSCKLTENTWRETQRQE